MKDAPQPEEVVKVACEICLKEIPSSEAKMEEASDYTLYFCGLECYGIWLERGDTESG